MTRQALDGHYGRRVDVDLCHACGALWFDRTESLALSAHAVLQLFTEIDAHRTRRTPIPDRIACPTCGGALTRTSDLQRATRFSYWRCAGDDGRFITFFDFLREKNFVRPLAPRELAALREKVQTLACSSCGAPVDLAHDSACRYCHAPIAVLDPDQVAHVLEEVRRIESERKQAMAELPLRLLADRAHVEKVFTQLRHPEWSSPSDSFGVLEHGVSALAGLLDV